MPTKRLFGPLIIVTLMALGAQAKAAGSAIQPAPTEPESCDTTLACAENRMDPGTRGGEFGK